MPRAYEKDVWQFDPASSRRTKAAAKNVITFDGEVMGVLKLDLMDVQQLFARCLAARFPGTAAEQPQKIDGIVNHGDADNFSGRPRSITWRRGLDVLTGAFDRARRSVDQSSG